MNKKIIVFFVVLLFSLSMVWADNNTTDTSEVEDSGNYILPISISDGEIKFNDGFTGFGIDSNKNKIEMSDEFLLATFSGDSNENTVKLIIIEAYKQGKENDIAKILNKFVNGDSNDDVISEALNSNEKISDNAVVKIDNTTEATFNFEYLQSVDDDKSDCIAYKVSMKTTEEPVLTSPAEDTDDSALGENNDSDDDKTSDSQNKDDKKTEETQDDKTSDSQNKDDKKTEENQQDNNNDTKDNQKQNGNDAADGKNKTDDDTTVNETNKTIVNNTNTVIVNENNTTVINNNNVKTINNTNDTPENDTTSQLLKAAGNPIFILIIVIVIIAIVAVVVRRKD